MAMYENWRDGKLTSRWNEVNKRIETMAADGITVASFVAMTPEQSAQADDYIAKSTATANSETLRARGLQALTGNSTYLGVISPTNAQVAAQVRALTKQVNALIRLELRELNNISDTA